jgi:hypothetical protein
VHTCVWIPTHVSSILGSHYYVTFIGDTTRKIWVYFIQQKFDVFILLRSGKILLRMRQEKG